MRPWGGRLEKGFPPRFLLAKRWRCAKNRTKASMEGEPGEITGLLGKLSSGQAEVSARLIELVYTQLRSIAGRCMQRERPGHTLQPTVLVHEAYLRLAAETGVQWQSRAHFFGFAARIMRRVLLDYAREHRALKRGGAAARI